MVAATLVTMMLLPAGSVAGVYHVYSCRIPYGPLAGEAAPVEMAAEGYEASGRWSHVWSGSVLYSNACSSGGTLSAGLTANSSHSDGDLVTWEFTAPSGETIQKSTVWVSGDADGGSGYLFWLATPTNPSSREALTSENEFGGCAYIAGCVSGIGISNEPFSAQNETAIPTEDLGGSHLYINASCSSASCPSNKGDEQGHAVIVYVYATDIALEQQSSPTINEVTGELAEQEDLAGSASLFFKASDTGSGIYKTVVKVDGEITESPTIDETATCKEIPVPAEDGPAFLSAKPCPAQANGHVSLDTEKLSNGTHHLLVEVTDAAGNATTVLSRSITVANPVPSGGSSPSGGQIQQPGAEGPRVPGQPQGAITPLTASTATGAGAPTRSNGTPASANPTLVASWVKARGSQIGGSGRTQLTGGFDDAETIIGRLTSPGGGAISGASIVLSAHESAAGASTTQLGAAETNSQGRFAFHLRKQSPSEQIDVSYSSTVGGEAVVSKLLRLRVRAGIQLRVAPASVSVNGTIRLQGRVLGAKIPPGGKQVVLEARSKGSRWLQFLVLRTDGSGRFAGSHRFRLPGPVRYWFRAVCPEEADFPFQAGTSDAVTVWER